MIEIIRRNYKVRDYANKNTKINLYNGYTIKIFDITIF